MLFKTTFSAGFFVLATMVGCSDQTPTGKACLGADGDTLVETLGDQCQAGDTIASKQPGYYCNFNYAVAYNNFNSAFCVYIGKKRDTRGQ